MLSSFHFAVSALLKALCSLALSVSHTVVPLCSPCYRKNFILSVREALYDPVLHHGSRFDFDMNFCMLVLLCVCVCVHMCVCIRDSPWRGYIISDQCISCLASWLILPFPLDKPSLYCPTSNSLACYHDNTILPPQSPHYRPVPILTLIHRQPTLPTLYPLWPILSEPD